ncbi:hypothetical protein EBS02_06190 [bacterium]|nr:hypothetical protein [bacterium]
MAEKRQGFLGAITRFMSMVVAILLNTPRTGAIRLLGSQAFITNPFLKKTDAIALNQAASMIQSTVLDRIDEAKAEVTLRRQDHQALYDLLVAEGNPQAEEAKKEQKGFIKQAEYINNPAPFYDYQMIPVVGDNNCLFTSVLFSFVELIKANPALINNILPEFKEKFFQQVNQYTQGAFNSSEELFDWLRKCDTSDPDARLVLRIGISPVLRHMAIDTLEISYQDVLSLYNADPSKEYVLAFGQNLSPAQAIQATPAEIQQQLDEQYGPTSPFKRLYKESLTRYPYGVNDAARRAFLQQELATRFEELVEQQKQLMRGRTDYSNISYTELIMNQLNLAINVVSANGDQHVYFSDASDAHRKSIINIQTNGLHFNSLLPQAHSTALSEGVKKDFFSKEFACRILGELADTEYSTGLRAIVENPLIEQRQPVLLLDVAPTFEDTIAIAFATEDPKLLLAALKDNPSEDVNRINSLEGGMPLIVWTANHSDQQSALELINLLIERNVNINVQDRAGNTALHKAVSLKNDDACTILLNAGADSSICNNNGDTPKTMMENPEISTSNPALIKRMSQVKTLRR